jgi:hypothetical protein
MERHHITGRVDGPEFRAQLFLGDFEEIRPLGEHTDK